MKEPNEGKVANLLASLGNLPMSDLQGAILTLIEIVKAQQKQIEERKKIQDIAYHATEGLFEIVRTQKEQIEELSKRLEEKASIQVHYDRGQGHYDVSEFRMCFMEGGHVWFDARTKTGKSIQTLPLKGEV